MQFSQSSPSPPTIVFCMIFTHVSDQLNIRSDPVTDIDNVIGAWSGDSAAPVVPVPHGHQAVQLLQGKQQGCGSVCFGRIRISETGLNLQIQNLSSIECFFNNFLTKSHYNRTFLSICIEQSYNKVWIFWWFLSLYRKKAVKYPDLQPALQSKLIQ